MVDELCTYPSCRTASLAEDSPGWFHDSLVSFRPSLAPSVTISEPCNIFDFNSAQLRFRCIPIHLDVPTKELGVLDLRQRNIHLPSILTTQPSLL